MTIFSKLKNTKFVDYLDKKSKLKRYLSFMLFHVPNQDEPFSFRQNSNDSQS